MRSRMNTTNKYLVIEFEAKREALAKMKPLLKSGRRLGKWHQKPNPMAWITAL